MTLKRLNIIYRVSQNYGAIRTKTSHLWLVVLLLASPIQSDQTIIKQTDESEDKTIDIKTIDDRKNDVHTPYDKRNVLTYLDFNKRTKNESDLRIANYSPTYKEKESYLSDNKSAIDTVVSTEEVNKVFGISSDDTSSNDLIQKKNLHKEEKNDVTSNESNYMKEQKVVKNLNSHKLNGTQISDEEKFLTEKHTYFNGRVERNLDDHSKQERKENDIKLEPRDITIALEQGMRALEDLIKVKEPLLYKLGLYLDENDPAAKVAQFGAPVSQKAILMSRIGYATLEASRRIAETFHKNVGRQSAGIPADLQSKIDLDECPLRGRPRCPSASRWFRTSDGTCNNLEHPWRGSAMLPMHRFLPPVYEDGIQAVRRSVLGIPLPSPREITTVIHRDKDREIHSVTLMFMQWGQFIDHDITSTVKSRSFNGTIPRCCDGGGRRVLPPELLHPSCLPIEVPRTDPFLSRFGIGCMEFIRSAPSTRIDCELGWREQINQVTPYIDASTIYGSDVDTSDSIRTFRNGKLFYGRPTSEEPLNPPDPPEGEICRTGALSEECLQAGDGRVSENPGLVAMHTIFVRYHNKVATVLSKSNPHWSDERVFQETRKIVYSVIQHITYREYLPIVLGPEVMDLFELRVLKKGYYDKYSAKINPGIANAFSTAAFRFGHSMVQNSFVRTDSHHIPLPNNVSLHDEFSNFENIWSFGSIDRFLLGMSNQPSQKRDEFIAEELTNHLFQFSNAVPFGMDLASINIQRGRDHGIPPYTFWRKPCGLSPIEDWNDLEQVISISSAIRLRSLYFHVDDIDLFTAGLAEKPLRGAVVGPTFACIIAQQFSNLRKGDRFWYENEGFESSFSPAQLQQIKKVSLAQIMCQTMDEIETIQPFVFLSADTFKNVRVSCDSAEIRNFDLGAWVEKSFEFNSISGNIDSFEEERSQTHLFDSTRLGRENDNDLYVTKTIDNEQDQPFDSNDSITEHTQTINGTSKQLTTDKTDKLLEPELRHKRSTKNLKNKGTKTTTERSRITTTKTKTTTRRKITKATKSTTTKPYQTNITRTAELKYGDFNNIPMNPTFSLQTTSRPTKIKPNYYQVQENDHNDVTYLLGLVPKRTTTPTTNPPLQLNIHINYSPESATTPNYVSSTNKNKRPSISSRPAATMTNNYATSRPTLTNIYRPTQTHQQDDVVVITKRPITSTRRPFVTTKKPEAVSYPIFVYSPAYDKPEISNVASNKPTYFFDNMEYATTNGLKRPNYGYGHTDNYDRPKPASGHNYGSVVKLPSASSRPSTGYYTNTEDDDDDFDENVKPVYISSSNSPSIYRPTTIFEDRPFTTSNQVHKYSDRYSTSKKPTYSSFYFDNDSDTVVITPTKKRPPTNTYNNDKTTSTDDILNEFFQKYSTEDQITHTKSSDFTDYSTPKIGINDKLDFKNRMVYKTVDDKYYKDEHRFIKLSVAGKEEETLHREGDDVIKEEISNGNFGQKAKKKIKKIRLINVDIAPSEPSGQWKLLNASENTVPYMDVPELPLSVPCSYEVPKPMTQFLPAVDDSKNAKTR